MKVLRAGPVSPPYPHVRALGSEGSKGAASVGARVDQEVQGRSIPVL
jgi:hypothetical protein